MTYISLFGLYSLLRTKILQNKNIGKINSVLRKSHLFKVKVMTRVVLKFDETVRVKCQKITYDIRLALIIA